MKPKNQDAARLIDELVRKIKPMLAGHDPGVQGGVLLQLVALWLAGHHPKLRAPILGVWADGLEPLVPVMEAEIFGDGPRPEGWGD